MSLCWTKEEVDILYMPLTYKEIAKTLTNRSANAIRNKCISLGIDISNSFDKNKLVKLKKVVDKQRKFDSDFFVNLIRKSASNFNLFRIAHPKVKIKIEDANFYKLDLSGINLSGTTISNCNFNETTLNNSCFRKAVFDKLSTLSHVTCTNSDFSYAILASCKMRSSSFRKCIFVKANMQQINASFSSFIYCDLTKARLTYGHMKECDFYKAKLDMANMYCSQLEKSTFEKASMVETNLDKATLIKTTLCDANLEGAIISYLNHSVKIHFEPML